LREPDWQNPRADPVWKAAFGRASSAIAQVDISDLTFPDRDYTTGITLHFDAPAACAGQ
jgi:hypothetical protein